MSRAGQIVAIYASVFRDPTRFVVRRRMSASHERYDVYQAHSLRDLVVQLLEVLSDIDAQFMDKVAAVDDREFMTNRHKMRRYVAKDRSHLYINSPQLTESDSIQIRGYWIILNIGRKEVSRFFSMSCAAAGISREHPSKLPICRGG